VIAIHRQCNKARPALGTAWPNRTVLGSAAESRDIEARGLRPSRRADGGRDLGGGAGGVASPSAHPRVPENEADPRAWLHTRHLEPVNLQIANVHSASCPDNQGDHVDVLVSSDEES
jgi:hypothetical protein